MKTKTQIKEVIKSMKIRVKEMEDNYSEDIEATELSAKIDILEWVIRQ